MATMPLTEIEKEDLKRLKELNIIQSRQLEIYRETLDEIRVLIENAQDFGKVTQNAIDRKYGKTAE